MSDKNLLLIFIKNPQRGKVKTRLAKTVGEEKAYQTYLRLLNHTIDVASELDVRKQIWYSSFIEKSDDLGRKPSDRPERSDGSDVDFEKKIQQGNNLGERMSNAFKEGFEKGFKKVVVIGSDCPEITKEIIEDAFKILIENNVVIGPSEDGGYYLIGSNEFIPEIFDEIPWSTEGVFRETVRVLDKNEKHYDLLPTLNDIDTEEDLRNSDF